MWPFRFQEGWVATRTAVDEDDLEGKRAQHASEADLNYWRRMAVEYSISLNKVVHALLRNEPVVLVGQDGREVSVIVKPVEAEAEPAEDLQHAVATAIYAASEHSRLGPGYDRTGSHVRSKKAFDLAGRVLEIIKERGGA